MGISTLLRWQWEGYSDYHAGRSNLLLHIVVVPLFWLGNIGLVVGLLQGAWWSALAGAAAMGVSVALQGRGHRTEEIESIPFSSPGQAVARIFLEQWVNFPRFVVSGGWRKALRQAH